MSSNRMTETRLVSGPDAGRLRLTVQVTLDWSDEIAAARAIGAEEEAQENLDLPCRQRGIGPVGGAGLEALWNGLVSLVDRGRKSK